MSYATVSELRAKPYLEQVAAGAVTDAALEAVLGRANAIINDYLGFAFGPYPLEASARVVRAEGGEWLIPPAYQAASIVSIERISNRGQAGESAQAVTDYVCDEYEWPYRVWRASGWPRGGWYRVTAVWGYGPPPPSAVEVEIEVAVNIWRSGAASSFGPTIGTEGGGVVTVNRAITWAQRNILDSIRTKYMGVLHG